MKKNFTILFFVFYVSVLFFPFVQAFSGTFVDLTDQGIALNNLGRYQEALDAYDNALSINSNYTYAWICKGITLHFLGRYQEELDAYDKALSIAPNNAMAWSYKANALLWLNRYQEGLVAANTALAIDPNNKLAWNTQGFALEYLGRYQEALDAYNKSLSIDPNYYDAQTNKEKLFAKLGKDNGALDANNGIYKISDTFNISATSEKITFSLDELVGKLIILISIIVMILIIYFFATRKVLERKSIDKWMITLSLILLILSLILAIFNVLFGYLMLDPKDIYYSPLVGFCFIILFAILGMLNIKGILDLIARNNKPGIFHISIVIIIISEIICSFANPQDYATSYMFVFIFPLAIPPLLVIFFSNRYFYSDHERKILTKKSQITDNDQELRKIKDTKPFDAFISYQKIDKIIADAICSNLENRKIKCWYAPRDITPGADWTDAVSNAIQQSKVFIVVWTSNTQHSTWVKNEVTRALSSECIIIPFRIDNIDPDIGWSLLLGTTHWLDAYTPPLEERIDELGNVIIKNIND